MTYHECGLRQELTDTLNNRKCTTEFYINRKPQIYCYGIEYDDGIRKECVNCPNWCLGEQCKKDFESAKMRGELTIEGVNK